MISLPLYRGLFFTHPKPLLHSSEASSSSTMKTSFTVLSILTFTAPALCEVGNAVVYQPPYTPKRCPNTSLPSTGYFIAVGDGEWDNGAACGRKYSMRCIAQASNNNGCIGGTSGNGPPVTITAVDYRPVVGLSLSTDANKAIQNGGGRINIEYQQR